nr:MAG: hypothetical protein EDM05_35660 [Leptolyngbya sp. IPPAS B-1204]RNJ64633.1 MAG: hypothetical protein EDM05_35460 [Leptolyngbya sp. IPPAS B-1204]
MFPPTGYRAIETLQVGEWVLACDPDTGVVKAGQILQTFVREVAVVFIVNDSTVITDTASGRVITASHGRIKQ